MFILETQFGNDGYASWFKILEQLGASENHYIDCKNEDDWEFLTAKTRVEDDFLRRILSKLAKLNAINQKLWEEEQVIYSDNFLDGIKDAYRNRKIELLRKEDLFPHLFPKNESSEVSDVRNPEDEEINNVRKPQIKLKKTKVNKNKINESKVNNLEEEAEEKNDFQIFGEYENVFLTDQAYKKLETEIMSKDKLCEFIEVLLLRIETGKENDHIAKGKGHLARIRDIYKYRKKFPEKFIKKEGGKQNATSSKGQTNLDNGNSDGWSL